MNKLNAVRITLEPQLPGCSISKEAAFIANHRMNTMRERRRDMEKLYTRREAASMLGISLTSLDTARNTGAIAFIQYVPNGSVFFTEEALQEYIAKHTYQAKPEERRVTYRKPWAHK